MYNNNTAFNYSSCKGYLRQAVFNAYLLELQSKAVLA
jgi:hypothetical protein